MLRAKRSDRLLDDAGLAIHSLHHVMFPPGGFSEDEDRPFVSGKDVRRKGKAATYDGCILQKLSAIKSVFHKTLC